jgi:hypothetical protein
MLTPAAADGWNRKVNASCAIEAGGSWWLPSNDDSC